MRMLVTFALLSLFLAACIALNGASARNLILTEQELRFAGTALRTVLASNANSYLGKKGSRRFSGTFTIVERENGCGNLDIRINADVELLNGSGNNGNRNRSPNNNYTPNNPDNNYNRNNFGNAAQAGGYAGQYNY